MDVNGETMEAAGATRTREEVVRESDENKKEALTQPLQPNFNRSNVTEKQISKLQELHKRRMQIKANSNIQKKPKASKHSQSGAAEDGQNSKKMKESASSSTLEQLHDHKTVVTVPKRPQKLYWGLDTKERWERKANM